MRGGEIMELKGSKTEKNLLAALPANPKPGIATPILPVQPEKKLWADFRYLSGNSENEKEHAKLFFNLLKGGDVEIVAAYPAGVVGTPLKIWKRPLPERILNGRNYTRISLM